MNSDPKTPLDTPTKPPLTSKAKLAVASLICGIVALAYPACITGPICGFVAIAMGLMAVKSEKPRSAIAGIVLGFLALAAFAFLAYLKYEVQKALHDMHESFEPMK